MCKYCYIKSTITPTYIFTNAQYIMINIRFRADVKVCGRYKRKEEKYVSKKTK